MTDDRRPAGLKALVLAGSRSGRPDPMATGAGLSHKALLPVGDAPMLLRVLRALRACPEVGDIVVSSEEGRPLLSPLPDVPSVISRGSRAALSDSVGVVLEEFGPRLLVTTADHALLTPQMVSYFLATAPVDADVVAAVARSSVVEASYPDTRRTWMRFRDGRFTGCNMFLLQTSDARHLLSFWRRVEQARKRPHAIATLFGPIALLLYVFRAATLDGMLGFLGWRTGLRLASVAMPFAEAAIDVDKPADLALVRRILADRETASASAA